MKCIDDSDQITIEGWMINKLHLKGNKLITYAAIQAYSDSDDKKKLLTRKSIAGFCGCSLRTVDYTLKSLVDDGYIKKITYVNNKVKYCYYEAF